MTRRAPHRGAPYAVVGRTTRAVSAGAARSCAVAGVAPAVGASDSPATAAPAHKLQNLHMPIEVVRPAPGLE